MSNFINKSNRFLSVLPLVVALLVSSCSDDNNEVTTKSNTTVAANAKIGTSIVGNNKNMTVNRIDDKHNYKQMSQPVDKASWVEKGKFKKEFTKDCITREVNSAGSQPVNLKYIETTCACIANYMDDKLTDQEADEFLKDDNHVRALQMRYDAGAYKCVQETQKEQEPKITRFQ